MSKTRPRPETASQIALPWIVRLRYGMALGQIAVALLAQYLLKIDLPLSWIALGPLLVGTTNLLLAKRASQQGVRHRLSTSALVGWVFALDTICLTGLLMLSGGPSNPFTLLYLVHITLAATILTKRQTWLLGGLSTLCFALLFRIYRPVPAFEMHHYGGGSNLHLIGMWISFTVAALLVALYSAKISELLREHEESLLNMQEELAKKDRLASLVTLAAGAAHELSTPLATIAIVARELERFAATSFPDGAVAEDSRLIRREVDRCREILLRMSVQGAEPAGEAAETIEVHELLDAVAREFQPPDRLRIRLPRTDRPTVLTLPGHAVQQALIALVKNALEASAPPSGVEIRVERTGEFVQFVVKDRGKGMSAETLRRIGEPFFTTKEPGKGMGLGTFLARTLAERLGGRLTIQSSTSQGTWAVLELPVSLDARLASWEGLTTS